MIRKEFDASQWELPFIVYAPSHIDAHMPMIIQLHGAGEVGNGGEDLYKLDIHGFSHIMTPEAEYPCLFVMPQCPVDSFWAAEIPNLHSLIQKLIAHFDADPSRIYLTGLSMGGFGTWLTACRFPKTFAAIAPICGGGMVWKVPVLDMPVWAFHGTQDAAVYPSETMNMIAKLRSVRPDDPTIKMTLLDNVGHNAWEYAYNETLIDWFLSYRRSGE